MSQAAPLSGDDRRRAQRAALVALLRLARRPPSAYASELELGVDLCQLLAAETRADLASPRTSAAGEREDSSLRALKSGMPMTQQPLFVEPDPDRAPDDLLARASAEIAGWEAEGIRLVAVNEAGYPPNLRKLSDRPPLIFIRGELLPGDARCVAVIGARRATAGGAVWAAEIARKLSDSGYAVVSGLAEGIDTAVHVAAVQAGGRTIGVPGTGLNRCYPAANADLQRKVGQVGAVVSRFWPEAGPSRQSFPIRNALMSGLSLATVIVEAAAGSGTQIQARHAIRHGRPVLMGAGMRSLAWACQLAECDGGQFFSSAEELPGLLDRRASSAGVRA